VINEANRTITIITETKLYGKIVFSSIFTNLEATYNQFIGLVELFFHSGQLFSM